jgi:Holliday junction resolvase RusA-like endonuclease
MRSKKYCVNIVPIPWKRVVRTASRFYDSQAKDRVSFGLKLNQQHNGEAFFDKPVHLDVVFYMAIPKPPNGNKQYIHHAVSPSLADLYKFFLDAIQDILIADDRVICSLSVKKVYDKEPRTELTITEV